MNENERKGVFSFTISALRTILIQRKGVVLEMETGPE